MEEEELMHENTGVDTSAFAFQRQLKRASENDLFSGRTTPLKKIKKSNSLPSLTQSLVEENTILESSESFNRRPLTVSRENHPELKRVWSVKPINHAETLPSESTESLGNLVEPEEPKLPKKRSRDTFEKLHKPRRSTRHRIQTEFVNMPHPKVKKRPKIKPTTKQRRYPVRPHNDDLTIGERQAMFTPDEVVTLRIEGDAKFIGQMRYLKKAERISNGTLKFRPEDDFKESLEKAKEALGGLSFEEWHEGRNFHHILPVAVARKLKLTYKFLNTIDNAISLRNGMPLDHMDPKPEKKNGAYERQSKEVYLEISKNTLNSKFIKHKEKSETKLERFFKKSQHRLFNLGHHNYNLYVEDQLKSGTTPDQLKAVIKKLRTQIKSGDYEFLDDMFKT